MSGRQFTEWQLYEVLEPFGERGAYWRAGQICATVRNSQRAKDSDPIAQAEDYMPRIFFSDDDEHVESESDYAEQKALQERVMRGRK